MKTAVFRFTDNYAPKEGTVKLHEDVIKSKKYVWYGVFGIGLSDKNINIILDNPEKKVLLVKSKTMECYWCNIENVTKDKPDLEYIPSYYRNDTSRVKTWLKISKIEKIDSSILDKCTVLSTQKKLKDSINKGMSSYFIVDID